MKIHGLRIYPQSVEIVQGNSAPIFVHGSVSEGCSDFFYIFKPLASTLPGHLIAKDFGVSYDQNMKLEDPIPGLRKEFGSSLVAADLASQVLLLRGDDFEDWAAPMYFCEGALLPIFREQPTFTLLKKLYWGRDFHLTCESWPNQMRAVLHMWDDIYWQLFTTERADIDTLLQVHSGDPKLKMYFVDLNREYPDPSNQELQPATVSNET